MRVVPAAVLLSIALTASACDEERATVVRSLVFVGIEAGSETQLRAVLATRQGSRLPWGRKEYFDRMRLESDLKRIAAFYADRGYADVRVSGLDVRQLPEPNAVDITVSIELGDPVLLDGIEFRGFEALPPESFSGMKQQVPLVIGRPRDRRLVVATHELALNELRDHGYPYARVSVDEHVVGTGNLVRVTFAAEPGPLANFGPVEIVGNESVNSRVIDRELSYRDGDLYRRRAIQESQRRLYRMELFQFVNVETLDSAQQAPEVRTRVTVAEGRHQRVNFGVGYGTEEKARVEGEYRHVNFFGGARSAGVHGRWSSIDRGVRVDFNQPYIFAPHFSLGADGQQWYTDAPAYHSIVTGARATVTHRASQVTSWAVSILSEHDSSTISEDALDDPELRDELIALGLDPTTGTQEGTLSAVGLDWQRSTTDSAINTTRGYQLALHAEDAGRLLPGTFRYFGVSGDVRHYLPLGQRMVAANRLQFGSISAVEAPEDVPFSKKYFLGGATSIRGWGRYEVSPLASGLPVGGNSLFAWTSELRARLVGSVGGVAFLDAGNVWEDGWTLKLDDLRYAVGVGIRYQTPVGAVRFDAGYQLNPIEGLVVNDEPQSRPYRFHFSIGQAF